MSHLSSSTDSSDPLSAFFAALATLPRTHPRRIGLLVLQVGMAATAAALCLGLAAMHVSCGIAALGALVARPPLHRLPGFWFAAAFAAWQVLSVVTVLVLHRHPHPLGGLGMMYIWVSLYLAQVAFSDPRARLWACRALAATACLSVALATVQFFYGLGGRPPLHVAAPPLGERMHHSVGFAPVHITQAFTMAMVALVFAHLPAIAAGTGRALRWSAVGVTALGLILANARLAFLGASAGFGVGVATSGRRSPWRGVASGLALLLAFAAGLRLLAPSYFSEAVTAQDGRLAIWRTSMQIVAAAPLVGTGGAESFKDVYRETYRAQPGDAPLAVVAQAPHAHNSELAIAAEHGIPAALFHLAWIGALLGAAFRTRTTHPGTWSLACALVATFLVAGTFEDLAGHSAPSYVFCITLGLCLAPIATPPSPAPW